MRKILALDANLLVLLIVGVVDPRYVAVHRRLHPTYRPEHFDILRTLILDAPALATTTHALTEASNLVRQCREPLRSQVTLALAQLIATTEERSPRASDVCAVAEFIRLGLTDAAFTLLDPSSYRVLSADLALILALQRRGFEVTNFHQLLFD